MGAFPVLGAGTSGAGPATKAAPSWIDDVVRRERDEERRADPEAYQRPGKTRAVVRQRVARQVRGESLRAVVELDFVVAGAGHPRTKRRRGLAVVAEVGPHRGLRRRVQVRVAEIAVQQVEQRLELLHGLDRKAALRRRENPGGVRGREVAVAGPAEGARARGARCGSVAAEGPCPRCCRCRR